MCLVSNERRENALDKNAYSLIKSCVAMKISHLSNGFPFIGMHCITEYCTKLGELINLFL